MEDFEIDPPKDLNHLNDSPNEPSIQTGISKNQSNSGLTSIYFSNSNISDTNISNTSNNISSSSIASPSSLPKLPQSVFNRIVPDFGNTPPVDLTTKIESSKLLIHPCQAQNRVLKYIKNVVWEYANISPDFLFGKDACGLFLSLKYHLLHSDYIEARIKSINKIYSKRIILCLVDSEENRKPLMELSKLIMHLNSTLIIGWSNQEIGRYLEIYKVYEKKGPDTLKERPKEDFFGRVTDVLTSVKSVNRTDVENLLINFGDVKSIFGATMEEFSLMPGVGEKKVKSLYETFHQPFVANNSKKQLKINQISSFGISSKTSTTMTKNEQKEEVLEEEIEELLSLQNEQIKGNEEE